MHLPLVCLEAIAALFRDRNPRWSSSARKRCRTAPGAEGSTSFKDDDLPRSGNGLPRCPVTVHNNSPGMAPAFAATGRRLQAPAI